MSNEDNFDAKTFLVEQKAKQEASLGAMTPDERLAYDRALEEKRQQPAGGNYWMRSPVEEAEPEDHTLATWPRVPEANAEGVVHLATGEKLYASWPVKNVTTTKYSRNDEGKDVDLDVGGVLSLTSRRICLVVPTKETLKKASLVNRVAMGSSGAPIIAMHIALEQLVKASGSSLAKFRLLTMKYCLEKPGGVWVVGETTCTLGVDYSIFVESIRAATTHRWKSAWDLPGDLEQRVDSAALQPTSEKLFFKTIEGLEYVAPIAVTPARDFAIPGGVEGVSVDEIREIGEPVDSTA